MSDDQEWRPEDGGADGEMIVEMAGNGPKRLAGDAVFVKASVAKTGICILIVVGEIEVVLDQRRAKEGVIANAIAANPGIDQREREQEKNEERAQGTRRGFSERLRHRITFNWHRMLCEG
jgi:hypothetical protein